jgi:ribosome biogenesis protein SSF1/2
MGKKLSRKDQAKSKRMAKKTVASEPVEDVPRSFVFSRGDVPLSVKDLVKDLRETLRPHTATKLTVQRSNNLRDFMNVAGPLGVSHFVVATAAATGSHLRIMRIPRGPTATFRITAYSLVSDVARLKKRPVTVVPTVLDIPPLVVLNNFTPSGELKKELGLLSVLFQNMFPSVNVATVRLTQCKRVVLFDYSAETGLIEFRHYLIKMKDSGTSRSIKRVLSSRLPNLENLSDISEFVLGSSTAGGYPSDSEGESDPDMVFPVTQTDRKGVTGENKRSIKLIEVGPRMSLSLVKIQQGVDDGEVLYHAYIERTKEEAEKLRKEHEARAQAKARRRAEQAANVKRKAATEGDDMPDDLKEEGDGKKDGGARTKTATNDAADDIEWYRREVGEEPDEDFKRSAAQNAAYNNSGAKAKKEKYNPLFRKRKRPQQPSTDQGGADKSSNKKQKK